MKAVTCVVIALACVLGLVVADFGYGASYMPVYGGYGAGRGSGFGQGGFLALIGLLFLIFILFGFNKNTGTSSVMVMNLTG